MLTDDQRKAIAIDCLNRSQSWNNGIGSVSFKISAYQMESVHIADQLAILGVNNVIDSISSGDLHEKILNAEPNGQNDAWVDTEANGILVNGEENLRALADSGVNFPGAKFYRSKATAIAQPTQWLTSVDKSLDR
jgi:hypothetical protein